jgi:hypothetical protein
MKAAMPTIRLPVIIEYFAGRSLTTSTFSPQHWHSTRSEWPGVARNQMFTKARHPLSFVICSENFGHITRYHGRLRPPTNFLPACQGVCGEKTDQGRWFMNDETPKLNQTATGGLVFNYVKWAMIDDQHPQTKLFSKNIFARPLSVAALDAQRHFWHKVRPT